MRTKIRGDPDIISLTKDELLEPYSNLYYTLPVKIPDSVLKEIYKSPFPEEYVLPFENINELLNPGYLPLETGYAYLSDGSIFIAMLTKMQNVTGEMIDWWFWWNPQNPLRYKIMYPQAHFGNAYDEDSLVGLKKSGPYNQRLWNTTTHPVEDIGIGKERLSMHFVPPEKFGFDTSQFEEADVATVICGIVGSLKKRMSQVAFTCQFARKINNGIELRSRCWIGHTISLKGTREQFILNQLINNKFIKRIIIPRQTGLKYCLHCAQEYHNLAQMLPELYSSYA